MAGLRSLSNLRKWGGIEDCPMLERGATLRWIRMRQAFRELKAPIRHVMSLTIVNENESLFLSSWKLPCLLMHSASLEFLLLPSLLTGGLQSGGQFACRVNFQRLALHLCINTFLNSAVLWCWALWLACISSFMATEINTSSETVSTDWTQR